MRKKQRFLDLLTGFKFDMFNYTHKHTGSQEARPPITEEWEGNPRNRHKPQIRAYIYKKLECKYDNRPQYDKLRIVIPNPKSDHYESIN